MYVRVEVAAAIDQGRDHGKVVVGCSPVDGEAVVIVSEGGELRIRLEKHEKSVSGLWVVAARRNMYV